MTLKQVSVLIIMLDFLFLWQLGYAYEDKVTTDTSKMVVYYFHGDMRCHSCLNIERYTKETVRANFEKEITSNTLELKIVNFDQPGNDHYPVYYRLSSPSVILSDRKNGREVRWKNLGKIWDHEPDKDAFVQYIREEIVEFMNSPNSSP